MAEASNKCGDWRPITAQDVVDGVSFRGVANISGAPIELQYISGGVVQTDSIPDGIVLPFTFKPLTSPAGLKAFIDFAAPNN